MPAGKNTIIKVGLNVVCSLGLLLTTALGEALRFDFSPPFSAEVMKRIETGKKELTVQKCRSAPKIDGLLLPEEWDQAADISALVYGNGDKASPPIRIRMMFDEQNLYLATECELPPGQKLAPMPSRTPERDSGKIWSEDRLEIWIKPVLPAGKEYQFVIGANGAIFDLGGGDEGYNPDWKYKVDHTPKGWKAEMAIPREALQVANWPVRMAFNIGRNGPYVKTASWTGVYGAASQGEIRLEGIATTAQKPSTKTAGGKGALITNVMRSYARPGDRWLEIGIEIPKFVSGKYRLEASLFRLNEDQPAAKAETKPDRDKGTILVDLRRLKLSEARLRLTLFEADKPIETSEMFLTAQSPEKPIKAGEKIKVLIDVPAGINKVENWPITFGVPFAAGTLWDVDQLRLVDKNGKGIPSQVEASGLWAPEGAVMWARVDALVSAVDGCFVEIFPEGKRTLPKPPLTLTEKDGKIIIDTGVSTYVLGKGLSPIIDIFLGGRRVATGEKTRGLYVVDQNGRTASASADEESMGVEASGPVSACVRFEGYYKTEKGENLARHITRVECFAGQAQAKVTHTLVLCNSTTNMWFKDIGWEFSVDAGSNAQALFGISRSEWQKTYAVPLNSSTPIPRNPDTSSTSAYMLQDRHYHFAHDTNHFVVAEVNKGGQSKPLMEGDECGDWAALVGSGGGLGMVCKESARQHPKEFEVSSSKAVMHLFSNRGGEELDFRTSTLIQYWDLASWYSNTLSQSELPNIPNMVAKVRKLPSNAIGWAKTHELKFVPLGAEKENGAVMAQLAYLTREPVYALADPQWTYQSDVFGPLYPRDTNRFELAEKYIDGTFQVWEKRIDDWGNFGFIYFFTGPHLAYKGKYAVPVRYAVSHTYTLKSDLWRAYARSGDRRIRSFIEAASRAYLDYNFTHWAGDGKVKGLYVSPGLEYGATHPGNLPFHWEGGARLESASSSDLNNFIYDYQLTGYRRAADHVRQFGEGLKQFWTPLLGKKTSRPLMAMRLIVQAYGLTWDPELRMLAEGQTDTFTDPECVLGLSKERQFSTTYKTQVDVAALLDAWRILGSPRYYEMADVTARYWWQALLGEWPVFYCNPQGLIGNFLYRATGDPAYPEMLALQVRQAASGYDPGRNIVATAGLNGKIGAEASTFVFQGIPYAEDAIVRSGADRETVAAWVAYDDYCFPNRIVAFKKDKESLRLTTVDGAGMAGEAGGVRVRPVKPPITGYGLNLNKITSLSWKGVAEVYVPKDAPEGGYEIVPDQSGYHCAVANTNVPLVLYAPEYWKPMPLQAPAIRWYFSAPASNRAGQIFFEGAARLYQPDGRPFRDGVPQSGWVSVPAAQPGIWAFEPVTNQLVRVRNLPPFFAARSASNYFIPQIEWQEEPVPAPRTPVAPDTLYVPGVIERPGDQALYLGGNRRFVLPAGAADPAGNGGQFLPFKEGTVEFYFKPDWSTFDLPSKSYMKLLTIKPVTGDDWYLEYIKKPEPKIWLDSHILYGCFMTDGLRGRKSFRLYRQTIFKDDEWVHVAWVWGPEKAADTQKRCLTSLLFVNGQLGNVKAGHKHFYPWYHFQGNLPADQPKALELGPKINAVYDELRISDIQRYTGEFIPPARNALLTADSHTRALFHFNGNTQGESYGKAAAAIGEIKEK